MITLDQIRQTEDKAKVNRLSEANLLSEDDRQDYIDWLNQTGQWTRNHMIPIDNPL